jgi:predicted branched-subunit amino acid permease
VPSLWAWILWQVFGCVGIVSAHAIPSKWPLDFMATIALLVLLIPMTKLKPMAASAWGAAISSIMLKDIPLRLGVIIAIVIGMCIGFLMEKKVNR